MSPERKNYHPKGTGYLRVVKRGQELFLLDVLRSKDVDFQIRVIFAAHLQAFDFTDQDIRRQQDLAAFDDVAAFFLKIWAVIGPPCKKVAHALAVAACLTLPPNVSRNALMVCSHCLRQGISEGTPISRCRVSL